MLLIENICNRLMPHTACPHFKDTADNGCRFGIDLRSVILIITLNIAVGACGSHILSGSCVTLKNGSQLFGRIGGVPLIENIHYREHIHRRTVRIERINVVGQGNEADIIHRKNVVHILTYHDIVTSETAHILTEYQVNVSCLCIIEQSLHTRSVERSSADTIVDISIVERPTVFVDIVGEYSSLVFD